MIEFINVESEEQIHQVKELAWEIFHEHYDEYLEPDHVEFFLQKYQSVDAIRGYLDDGQQYYLLHFDNRLAGYLALERRESCLRISKLYILDQFRNKKIGDQALSFSLERAKEMGVTEIDLFVNENNHGGIRFYKRYGFIIDGAMTHSYENGHTEVDIRMTLSLS